MKDFEAMRAFFESGATRDLAFRQEQLKRLRQGLEQREERILEALEADLGKSAYEAFLTEVGIVYGEITDHLRHLGRWAKRRRVRSSLSSFPSSAYTTVDPLGVVLIISPWNYPFQLSLMPLVSAIAAGNCAVIKPSTQSSATFSVLEELVTSLFDPAYIQVTSDRSAIDEGWDHIFFTGGSEVGTIVATRAAERLIPVTLELGGKSPAIVTESANIPLAARRIAWGKFLNSGQTCVAPDYVLVDKRMKGPLVEEMKRAITAMFTSDPLSSGDLGSIINERHFNRLIALFEDGTLLWGGQIDPKRRRIAPTLMGNVDLSSPLMQEEIFGPILPIVEFDGFGEALAFIGKRPHPLAAYLFSQEKGEQRRFERELIFGGGCINDTVIHLSNPRLPFGGVGPSGMGSYHGKAGFLAFSHVKSINKSSTLIDIPVRYAPFASSLGVLKKLLR